MAKFTNYARGARGISLKDGSTVWLEPGESADIDKKDVAEPMPDLGSKSDAAADADGEELADLKDQVAALTKQVEAGTTEKAELTKQLGEASDQVATLTKQVEELSKKKS